MVGPLHSLCNGQLLPYGHQPPLANQLGQVFLAVSEVPTLESSRSRSNEPSELKGRTWSADKQQQGGGGRTLLMKADSERAESAASPSNNRRRLIVWQYSSAGETCPQKVCIRVCMCVSRVIIPAVSHRSV